MPVSSIVRWLPHVDPGALGVIREYGRRLAVRMRPAGGAAASAETPKPGPATYACGEVSLRALRPSEQAAWTRAMRENESRMREWWSPGADWKQKTDPAHFFTHYVEWQRIEKAGLGHLRAVVVAERVIGELAIYPRESGRVQEFGLWCAPGNASGRDLLGVICACIDDLMLVKGVERIEAPVAVGNAQPLRLIEGAGLVREGVMRKWRSLGPDLVDMELYAITRDRWVEHRSTAFRLAPWPGGPDV